jgi:hypothetical protein
VATNEFQQLVYLIHHQMKDRAGTTVTESKMVADRNTGKKREVDIVVEFTESGVPFLLAFETRGRSRKPTIEWVEQQIKKHEHLSDKLVLVANRAFTIDAQDLARRHGVEAVELGEATHTDWPAFIDQYKELFFAGFDFSVKEYRIEFELSAGGQPPNKELEILVSQGEQSATLPAAILAVLQNRELFAKPVMDQWYKLPLDQRKEEHTINVDAAPPADNPWILTQGAQSFRLTRLAITVAAKVGTVPILLGSAKYKDMRVAHGTAVLGQGSMAGQKVCLVMTERQGEKAKAVLMVTGKDPSKAVVHQLELEDDNARIAGHSKDPDESGPARLRGK